MLKDQHLDLAPNLAVPRVGIGELGSVRSCGGLEGSGGAAVGRMVGTVSLGSYQPARSEKDLKKNKNKTNTKKHFTGRIT